MTRYGCHTEAPSGKLQLSAKTGIFTWTAGSHMYGLNNATSVTLTFCMFTFPNEVSTNDQPNGCVFKMSRSCPQGNQYIKYSKIYMNVHNDM